MGALANADAVGRRGVQGEGPFVTMYLRLEGDRIAEAWFETWGCPVAIACGSWLTRWAGGRSLAQVSVIQPDDLARVLGGVPLGKEHCPELSVGALLDAVRLALERGGG